MDALLHSSVAVLTAACLQQALAQFLIEDISVGDDRSAYKEQYSLAMYLLDQMVNDVRVTLCLSDVGYQDHTSARLI